MKNNIWDMFKGIPEQIKSFLDSSQRKPLKEGKSKLDNVGFTVDGVGAGKTLDKVVNKVPITIGTNAVESASTEELYNKELNDMMYHLVFEYNYLGEEIFEAFSPLHFLKNQFKDPLVIVDLILTGKNVTLSPQVFMLDCFLGWGMQVPNFMLRGKYRDILSMPPDKEEIHEVLLELGIGYENIDDPENISKILQQIKENRDEYNQIIKIKHGFKFDFDFFSYEYLQKHFNVTLIPIEQVKEKNIVMKDMKLPQDSFDNMHNIIKDGIKKYHEFQIDGITSPALEHIYPSISIYRGLGDTTSLIRKNSYPSISIYSGLGYTTPPIVEDLTDSIVEEGKKKGIAGSTTREWLHNFNNDIQEIKNDHKKEMKMQERELKEYMKRELKELKNMTEREKELLEELDKFDFELEYALI